MWGGVKREKKRRRENHHLLSLNGLSIRDENTSIIVEKTSATPAFWKYFPKFVCVLRWFSPAPSCDLTKRDTLKSCLYRGGRHALHRMRTLMSPMCPSGVRTDQDYLLSLTVITRLAVEVYFLRASVCLSPEPGPDWPPGSGLVS